MYIFKTKPRTKPRRQGCTLFRVTLDVVSHGEASLLCLISETPCSDVGAGGAAGARGGLVEQEPWQPYSGCKTRPANTIPRVQTGRQMVPHMFEEVSPPLDRFTDEEEEEGKGMLLHSCIPILSSSPAHLQRLQKCNTSLPQPFLLGAEQCCPTLADTATRKGDCCP